MPYKVRRHFDVLVTDGSALFSRKQSQITAQAALDGIYVLRICAPDSEPRIGNLAK